MPGPLYDDLLRVAAENPALSPYLTHLAYGLMPPMPREFYLPSTHRDKTPITPEGTDLAVYTYETERADGKTVYHGIAFAGKANKPLWHYSFRDEASRQRYIDETANDRRARIKRMQERLDERKQFRHNLKVGDILYSSWGYDQTNIDFYQITEVKERAVVIRKIESRIDHEERGADYVVAVPNRFAGPPMTKIPQGSGNSVSIKISNYAYAHPWDGKPKYETAAGWGH